MTKDISFDQVRVGDTIRSTQRRVWESGTDEITSIQGVVSAVNSRLAVDSQGRDLAGVSDEWKRIVLFSRAAIEEPPVGSIIVLKTSPNATIGHVYVRYEQGWRRAADANVHTWDDILGRAGLSDVEVIRNGL